MFPSRYQAIFGPFAYWNNFGEFVEILLPVTLWRGLGGRRPALPFLLSAALQIGAVVASGSRAGTVLVILELVFVIALAYGRNRNKVFLLASASAILLSVLFVYAAGFETLIAKLQQSNQLTVRRSIDRSSLAMIRARPLTGWGLDTYVPVYRMFALYDDGTYVNRAHNDWLEWAAEGGVFFSGAMLVVLAWSIRPAIRSGWGIGLIAVCLHALVDYPFARFGVCGWYFCLLGMLAAARLPQSAQHHRHGNSAAAGFGFHPGSATVVKAVSIALFLCFAVVEGQTGSSKAPALPAEFHRVYELARAQPISPLQSIRVMTWNIDHGADLAKIVADMQREPVDLELLQEVDLPTKRAQNKDVAADLARTLGMNGAYAIEFEELSQENGRPAYIGQATLTRLPMRRSRVLRFARQSGFWKPRDWLPSSVPLMQRRIGNRIALVSELDFAGGLLVVYNAHLESRSAGPIQDHQLDEMLADAKQYPPGTAIVLGGDLNTKYLPSIFLHKLEAAGFRSALGERIERTHKIAMALDWIFVKGQIQVGKGAVRRDLTASDHYPVFTTVTSK